METAVGSKVSCSHCGEECPGEPIRLGDQAFCCEGCRLVFQLLDKSGLCSYYRLNDHPGINRRLTIRQDKFAFLEDSKIASRLITFQNGEETHVSFYLPQIHCSSCLFLLEQLHRLEPAVISCRVDFAAREASLIFDNRQSSLRSMAELLASLGYEPYISLRDWGTPHPKPPRNLVFQLGVAGFCFANIMLFSFPEYLGLDHTEPAIRSLFRYLDLLLSLPVVLYSARPFYLSAWKGLRRRFLNIDVPIVLAIGVTFTRSVWDVCSGQGSGYFDSMSGIVFFMLIGRVLQDRTCRHLSFDRDYRSYFPVAVTALVQDKASGKDREMVKSMADIQPGDTLRIYSGELIPADGLLTRGHAQIDYSFVTGESLPVAKQTGDLLYAGGRQTGSSIEMLVVREVAQSYLTQLWNRRGKAGDDSKSNKTPESDFSFVHPLSRYFTYIVFTLAVGAAWYWHVHDPSKVWTSITAVLIVACPCALFLSGTFTNGNLLRILGRHHFYLRSAEVIERIANTDHIVFDKTGTLTKARTQSIAYTGELLTLRQQTAVATLASQSSHPLSRAIVQHLTDETKNTIQDFQETPGKGIEGMVGGMHIALGSHAFPENKPHETAPGQGIPSASPEKVRATADGISPEVAAGSWIYVTIGGKLKGFFTVSNHYREGLAGLAREIKKKMTLSVLSGDNARERDRVQEILGRDSILLFDQTPLGKSRYIQHLQRIGKRVMMIGDGLNDAGALEQSDVGIALTDEGNNFTPASDAILRSDEMVRLPAFIQLCRAGKRIILASFTLSILYNLVGLTFAVSGALSPLVAAILMPSSSLTILLVTYGSSNMVARWLRL